MLKHIQQPLYFFLYLPEDSEEEFNKASSIDKFQFLKKYPPIGNYRVVKVYQNGCFRYFL